MHTHTPERHTRATREPLSWKVRTSANALLVAAWWGAASPVLAAATDPAAAASGAVASSPAGSSAAGSGAADAIERLISPLLQPDGAGCALSATVNGTPAIERTWGLADLEHDVPIRPDTVFEAGSVSKQFTAAAIAVLVADGRLALDDDVRRFVPELPDPGAPITLRSLLAHTSGVRNWDDLVELAGRPREDATAYTQREALDVIVRQSATNFRPGSEYLYSNSNYVLAAVVVERASGMPFAEFSRRRLFAPLGMTDTQWRDDRRRRVPRRAIAWTPGDDGVPRLDMPLEDVVGPGGLLTTVRDLQRWNAALDRPTADVARWIALLNTERARLADGTPIAYGLGLERDTLRGREIVSHAGATAGYRAYLARVPAAGLSVALLCNAGQLNTEDLGPEIVASMLPARVADPPSRVRVRPVSPEIAGRYRNVASAQPVDAVVADGRVRFNGGAPFGALDRARLRSVDGARSGSAERDASGAIARLHLTRVGNSMVTLERTAAWKPDAQTLGEFAGTFHSADADATWTFAVRDGALAALGPRGAGFTLEPVYRDAFRARDAYWIILFERDVKGHVALARFFKTRTRGVAFERQP